MAKYEVLIKDCTTYSVVVEANNEEEARGLALEDMPHWKTRFEEIYIYDVNLEED